MEIDNLGTDQWKWLNKYGSIDLTQWRMECFEEHGNVPNWYYVGAWELGRLEPYDVDPHADGGYGQRSTNLKSDRFYYWPNTD